MSYRRVGAGGNFAAVLTVPYPLAIIEDQVPIRETLVEYLCAQPEFDCSIIAGSMEEFLAQLAQAPVPPQLILSDIGLPGLTGIEGLPLVRARLPEAQVIMLSVYADAERVYQALCAGAVGYLLKDTPLLELKDNLLQVAAGGSPMSPAVARHVVRAFQRQAPQPAPAPGLETLTSRELEIVQGIKDGLSYKLIGSRHEISLDTVRNHIRSVYRKLHINSKGELLVRTLHR